MEQSKSANWFGTFNNPGDEPAKVLEDMHTRGKATYTCG